MGVWDLELVKDEKKQVHPNQMNIDEAIKNQKKDLLGCLHDHRPIANPSGWLTCSCGHPTKWNSGLYYKNHLIEVLRKNGHL